MQPEEPAPNYSRKNKPERVHLSGVWLHEQSGAVVRPHPPSFPFSHPDYTVGSGFAPRSCIGSQCCLRSQADRLTPDHCRSGIGMLLWQLLTLPRRYAIWFDFTLRALWRKVKWDTFPSQETACTTVLFLLLIREESVQYLPGLKAAGFRIFCGFDLFTDDSVPYGPRLAR